MNSFISYCLFLTALIKISAFTASLSSSGSALPSRLRFFWNLTYEGVKRNQVDLKLDSGEAYFGSVGTYEPTDSVWRPPKQTWNATWTRRRRGGAQRSCFFSPKGRDRIRSIAPAPQSAPQLRADHRIRVFPFRKLHLPSPSIATAIFHRIWFVSVTSAVFQSVSFPPRCPFPESTWLRFNYVELL